jgi:hypothetical protein
MLPGFSGRLISETVLERQVSAHRVSADSVHARRLLGEWRGQTRILGPASSLRALVEIGANPLARALGFSSAGQLEFGDRAAVATVSCGSERVALVVAGWGEPLDPLWRLAIVEAGRRSAAWALLFNGTHLRLVEAARTYSRRYAEFDLDLVLDEDDTFAAMWTLVRASAFATAGAGGAMSLRVLVSESEQHASSVCRSLRDGVLQASGDVLRALVTRPPRPLVDTSFEQALTIVYRILFLLFAEARGLVPLWHAVYRESYSIEALRETAERQGESPGLWEALRASCRLAHAGCTAGDLRVTAFNGRLFAPSTTPLADRRDLDDESARRAVLALSTRPSSDRAGRERIAYRDLGVEQLGAVYESLLDYEPKIEGSDTGAGRRPARPGRRLAISLEPGSGRRKSTGTFYTPQPIAEYLVRRTLEPLVREASPDQILQLRILDPSMGSGAFLVAASNHLARAYETALVRAGGCHPSDIGRHEQALIRRMVAERCLYGVDLNPMAVQLARLSLWLATLAADRPLSFLDHHLLTGDSLLGTWLACLRQAPQASHRRSRSAALPLFPDALAADALGSALPVRFTLGSGPNDTVEQVREKERALASLNRRDSALSKWKRVADLWCARWFSRDQLTPSTFGVLSDAILDARSVLPDQTVQACLRDVETIANARKFFHWELEFPEVFFDAAGERCARPGFDAVIGNPPWDMIRADSGSPEARTQARRDDGGVLRFVRDAGVYSSCPIGHANRYQLFLERAVAITKPGGRLGLVLPSGLATDHGSAPLRRMLFDRCAVDGLVGIDNRRGIFPIHRSVRFLLVTATRGQPTTEVACRLGETTLAALETGDEVRPEPSWFPVRVTPALLETISGSELAIPDFRSPLDVTIAERAAVLFAPLGADEGWSARFGRELNVTEDRHLFLPPGRGLPVVEGKQIEPFRVDLAGAQWSIARPAADRLRRVRHGKCRLGYRDVASATNRLTLIAAVLPAHCVSTHTVFCLRTLLRPRAQHFLCALFNSFVLNYLVRLRVTTHVTTAVVERLPVPRQQDEPAAFDELAAIGRLLARRHDPAMLARLNAIAARLYRLSGEEFLHVLDTFPLVPRADRDGAMAAFAVETR